MERKISKYEQTIYDFLKTQAGKMFLEQLQFEDYAVQLMPTAMTAEILAYAEGRRSIVRDFIRIKRDIEQHYEAIATQEAKKLIPDTFQAI